MAHALPNTGTNASQAAIAVTPKGQATRALILQTAAEVFAERGYGDTTMAELIGRSGMARGAFYFHFASKEELALATFRAKQQQLIHRLVSEAGEQADAAAQLAAMLGARARILDEDRSLRCVLTLGAELGGRAGPGSEYAAFQEMAIDLFEGLIRRGQGEGIFRPELDPRRSAETVFAAIIGSDLVSGLLAKGNDLVQRGEDLLQLLLGGLLVPPARANR